MAVSPILGIPVFLALAVTLLVSPVLSQTCKTQSFTNNAVYSNCLDLPTLTSYLHYTYDKANSSLSVAFAAAPSKPDGWIAWAVNPTGDGMRGAQSLIAFKASDGSVTAKTFAISSYQSIVESKLSFEVWDLRAESSDGVMRIFAKVKVPANAVSVNHVWQVGPSVSGGVPARHDFGIPNLNAKGKLSLTGATTTATTSSANSVDSRTKRKNIHGILNAVSWGILFPVGAMIARYVRTFESADPGWFYAHIFCQMSGYAIGVAGWATGLKLGGESVGIRYTNHRNIGIALFTLATMQIFALFLRPSKDHKFRFYWNVYHHGVGYAILALGIFNVFKGLNILNPEKQWKSAYLITIATLGAVSLLLEAITWVVVLRKKSNKSTKPYDGFGNGQGT